jgi:hypothetical protein
MKKKHAFIVGVVSLLGIYGFTLVLAPEAITTIGLAVVAGITGACGFSLGSSVADNWQRSKYYRHELNNRPELNKPGGSNDGEGFRFHDGRWEQ